MTRKTTAQISQALARLESQHPPVNRAMRRKKDKIARAFTNDMKRSNNLVKDNMAVAKDRVATLTEEQLTAWMKPMNEAFEKLRRGEAREVEFNNLVKCMNIAMILTWPEVARLLNDHVEKFSAAMDALAKIGVRVINRGTWTCYAAELEAIKTGIEFHGYQCKFASKSEMLKAEEILDAKERGADAGNIGKNGIDVHKLAEQEKKQ